MCHDGFSFGFRSKNRFNIAGQRTHVLVIVLVKANSSMICRITTTTGTVRRGDPIKLLSNWPRYIGLWTLLKSVKNGRSSSLWWWQNCCLLVTYCKMMIDPLLFFLTDYSTIFKQATKLFRVCPSSPAHFWMKNRPKFLFFRGAAIIKKNIFTHFSDKDKTFSLGGGV